MSYFNSSQVEVFPSTYRTYDSSTSKFTSEQNFVNIINSLVDKSSFYTGDDGFVLDYTGGTSGSGTLKVIIHGYYFEIEGYSPSSSTNILEIKVAKNAEYLANHFNSSTSLDSTGLQFQGLSCDNKITPNETNYNYYHVHVCDDAGNINKARLVCDSIKFSYSGKNTKTLTDELNAKQYNIANGQGIDTISNNQAGNNVIKLTNAEWNKLQGLLKDKETNSTIGEEGARLVYFDGSGIAHNSRKNAGSKFGQTGSYYSEQTAYIEDGKICNGITVWAGTGTPPSSSNVKAGDIYFKYQ